MRAIYTKLVMAIPVMLTGVSALAQESKWVVRGLPSYFSTADDKSAVIAMQPPPLGEETTLQSVGGAPGFGLAVEYLWRDHIGIEAAAFLSSHDVGMVISNDLGTFAATDSTRFRTFTVGANYHFETDGRTQWSAGAFVPLIFADGTDHAFPDLNRSEGRAYDQDYGVGVKGAMDWTFAPGSSWTLSVEGRYMFLLIMESETVGDIDVDPAVLSIGIGYRF
jgi:outer membrane protein W